MDPQPAPIEYKRLAFGIYLPAFLRMFGGALCGTYIPLYMAELGVPTAGIGFVVGAQAAGMLAADLPAGLMVSRLGTRRSMLLGILGVAVAFAFAAFTKGVILLAGLLFMAGFCGALIQISQLTIMRHAMPDRIRGRAMSLVGGIVRLAGAIAPFLGGLLVQAAGYAAVFGCYVALLVCAGGLFAWLGPRRQLGGTRGDEHILVGVKRVVRENGRVLLPAGGSLLVLSVLRTSRRVILPLWGHGLGLSPATIGMIVSAGASVDTLLFPLGGIISDKKGRKWSLGGCLGVFSCGLIALAVLGGNVPGLIAVSALIGAGNALGAGINMTVGTDLAPKGADAGPFLGLWRVITDTGGMLGPLAVGGIAQFFALGPAAVAIGLAGLGGTALMCQFMPEPKEFRPHTASGL
ncbi:MAG: MFS transporter [Lentisphaerae bacterium]|jgi:MFS family permease|nr:MFS transporter [Lentisphaerota bacterium]MBT4819468.1 MFS transporter [Lentisphaerota bacterium]MBT5611734.1 MFS transporter [Lentisphaerota bacterium]MBT7054136.1 MFS transporter [Lentisphaerota bacterium]MBT7848429.1 MFS transporter [Lentisphaerota bacterium]